MSRMPNRNAQRSIRLIQEAFVELVMEEPLEKITVTQITERADLNRGTFYAHFKDVDDLVRSISDSLADQIMVVIAPMMHGEFYRDPQPLLDQVGSFVASKRELFVRLVTMGGFDWFFQSLMDKVRSQLRDELAERDPERLSQALVACDYMGAGMLWAFRSWIVGGFGDEPAGVVSAELARLVQATSAAWEQG